MLFVGYDLSTKVFRLYDPKGRKTVKACDVSFLEDAVPDLRDQEMLEFGLKIEPSAQVVGSLW